MKAIAMIHEQLYESTDFREVRLEQHANILMSNLFSAFGVDPARISGQVVVCPRPDDSSSGSGRRSGDSHRADP